MIPAVWAPNAHRVEVHHGPDLRRQASVTPLDRAPAHPAGPGWWQAAFTLAPGTEYAYAVDGGPPRPDPRSVHQPRGPHEASRVFDPGAHPWRDSTWSGIDVRGAVTYEMHVGTFTPAGTFDAALVKLPYLADLGVDLVELMPVAQFPGTRGWGYDGVNLFAVQDSLGGPAALQRFVDAAHGHGLGVVLDVVYNHLGPSGNYLDAFGPYFTDSHETPWGRAVNLDQTGSGGVRRWICDNAAQWFRDFHIDALRIDAIHELHDTSPEHILAQLSRETEALAGTLGRPLGLVAESDLNDVRVITGRGRGGLGMTAQWADDVHHGVHAWLTGERQGYYADFGSPRALSRVLTRAFLHDGGSSTFRGRPWGAPVPPDTDGHRFVAFGSNHDQVGNRGLGDRPSATLSPGLLAIKAALILTSPFSPLIFMGEEWGASTPWMFFTDHKEPELAEAVRRGRVREFARHGWADLYGTDAAIPDPGDPATRDASVLDWSESATAPHAGLLSWNRTLLGLRRTVTDLSSGTLTETDVVLHPASEPEADVGTDGCDAPGTGADVKRAGPQALTVVRGTTRVLVNPTPHPVTFEVPAGSQILASWTPAVLLPQNKGAQVRVPPESVTVVGHPSRTPRR